MPRDTGSQSERRHSIVSSSHTHGTVIAAFALALVAASFSMQWRVGIELADEGYLWYGVWRTQEGEVPRLDFRGYDPARTYWVAFWSRLFGGGVFGIRAAVALFQAVGLLLGLLAASRVVRNRWILSSIGLVLLVWMYPRHKYFESAISMAAVYVVVKVIERPTHISAFFSGCFVGLAAAFRRNHGLYTALPLLVVNAYIHYRQSSWRGSVSASAAFAVGAGMGFFPVWLLAVLVPGFARAYLDSVLVIFARGTTNQPLPVPWPWTVSVSGKDGLLVAHELAIGMGFVLLLAIVPVAVVTLWRNRDRPSSASRLLMAATLVGTTYAHHAMVRSDPSHLTQAIHPALLGFVAIVCMQTARYRAVRRALLIGALSVVSVLGPLCLQPAVKRLLDPGIYEERRVLGDLLWVGRTQARLIDTARAMAADSSEAGALFFAPNLPGLYVVVGQRCPVWDPYPLWPAPPREQEKMVLDIDRSVRLALIGTLPYAGAEFADNFPLVSEYLQKSFLVGEPSELPRGYVLLERRKIENSW